MNNLIRKYQKIFVNIGIYFLASLIPMIFSLATNPLVAKNMSPEDYAIVSYYQAFNVLIAPFINFYLIHYYTKRFFELSENERLLLKATLFKSLIVFSFILTCIALIGLFIYTSTFNKESEIPFIPYAFISLFQLPLIGIYTLTQTEYRMQRKSILYFWLAITNGIAPILLTLILVVILKMGAFGRLFAIFTAQLLLFLYLLYKNRSLFRINFDKNILITAIKFCSPLVIAAMLTFFSNGFDKVALERNGDITALGIYAVGASIASFLTVFSHSINDTFQPDIYQSIINRNYKRCIKFITLKLSIMTLIVICFIICSPFIIDILTAGRYINSTPYAIILSLSSITSMLYYSTSQVTIALGYTSITLTNKIIGSILSVALYSILIPKYGAIGAAWATVCNYLFFFFGNLTLIFIKYKSDVTKNIINRR